MNSLRRRLMSLLCVGPALAAVPGGLAAAEQPKGLDAMECIYTRRSIRKYQDKPVPDQLLTEILGAAMTAPSAINEQPWHFVVVKNRDKLKEISTAVPYVAMAAGAGAGILVAAEPALCKDPDFWPLDCSNATMSILLACRALGLGAVWCAVHPKQDRMAKYRAMLGVPGSIMPFAFVCLGWPDQEAGRVNRFKPERIHRENWNTPSAG